MACLKKYGLSIEQMKMYVELCQLGNSTNQERKILLFKKQDELKDKLEEIQDSIDFIDKNYDSILNSK